MGQTMKTTASETFDGAAEEANRWLEAVMQELKTKDRDIAFAVLRAGLHALRDRMGAAHAVRLGERLPRRRSCCLAHVQCLRQLLRYPRKKRGTEFL